MAVATQSTSDFKGDHLSAKMYGGLGTARTVSDAAISASDATLTSATAAFSSADVGRVAIVRGAGAAGAWLVTTIASVTSATEVELADAAATTVSDVLLDIGPDDTEAIQEMMVSPNTGLDEALGNGGDGGGLCRLIPTGVYLVTPGEIAIPNPQSGIREGQGTRFNTILRSANPNLTDPILTLGDGVWEPHNFILTRLAIDANFGSPLGALYLDRTQWMVFRDLVIQHIGPDGIALLSRQATNFYAQQMIFDRLSIYAGDSQFTGGVPAGSVGVRLYTTGNITWTASNIENFETGMEHYGSGASRLTISGCHFERISKHALIIRSCEAFVQAEIITGDVWIGSDVCGSEFLLSPNSGAWTNGALVDNGFGNRIKRASSKPHAPGNTGTWQTGLDFKGDEWLLVEGLVDDPTFLDGVADWSAGGDGVISSGPASAPSVKSGRSLIVTSSAGGGYAERTFEAQIDTDYLLQVGLLMDADNQVGISVSDDGGELWSDTVDLSDLPVSVAGVDVQCFRMFRKRFPIGSTNTNVTVRITAVSSSGIAVCPLLLISKSELRMELSYATTGTGLTTTGSGADFTFNQNTSTGRVYTLLSGSHRRRSFVRAVVTVPAGVDGIIGITSDATGVSGGPQINLRAGTTAEYVIPLPFYPADAVIVFYSFLNGGTINIQDVGVYIIKDIEDAPFITSGPYPNLRPAQKLGDLANGWLRNDVTGDNGALTTHEEHLWLGDLKTANWQRPLVAATNFKRVIYASNIYWNDEDELWDITNSGGSDWAAMVMLNSGLIAFACQGSIAELPAQITDEEFEDAIKVLIPPTGDIQILTGQLRILNDPDGAIQCWILVGSGDPNGSVEAVEGSVYLNNAGGFGNTIWTKEDGGFSNDGWYPQPGALVRSGSGDPEGVVEAPVGTLYLRLDGAYGTTLYIKEVGAGNTGWSVIATNLIRSGLGSPEGSVVADPGSIYLNRSGGDGVTLWVKESGVSTNTGWRSDGGTILAVVAGTGNADFRVDKNIGLRRNPDTGYTFDCNDNAKFVADIRLSARTASRPLKLNTTKDIISEKVDVSVANDIAATGFASGNIPQWDGSKFTPYDFATLLAEVVDLRNDLNALSGQVGTLISDVDVLKDNYNDGLDDTIDHSSYTGVATYEKGRLTGKS